MADLLPSQSSDEEDNTDISTSNEEKNNGKMRLDKEKTQKVGERGDTSDGDIEDEDEEMDDSFQFGGLLVSPRWNLVSNFLRFVRSKLCKSIGPSRSILRFALPVAFI